MTKSEKQVSENHPSDSVVGNSLRAPNSSPPRQEGRIKDSDVARFDAGFFGLSHKQAEAMDPLKRVLLEVSYEAVLDGTSFH
jgi:acyl transferase domain-containing protein